ncbi:hypothetical protein CCACVL1_19487 [Corchorus capsularis]|uniref:O-methyltransferase dimerisation domain-containing protein n=1 Tax=Corchorus capsularis TaxID=210143 RepID=A0A1R3HGP7_COCAP|nr:hypothetical protein CCACVL1_19487 [Corchorus capsularis]
MGSIGSKVKESDHDHECVNAMLFSTSDVVPKVLNATIELGVLEIMAKAGPDAHLSATEIASQLPTQNPNAPSMLDRMLRFLATHSLLSCLPRILEDGSLETLYALTPASKFFLIGNENEGSLAPLSALANHPATQSVWYIPY